MQKELKIYDTASREKKAFHSLNPGQVKMYCCGPTVYDYLHIGNFRGAVFFNFVRNWLEFLNYKVDYIYNFTDIDDKILNRSLKEKIPPKELAEKYIKEFKKDYESLKLKAHTHNPRATETLKEIIHLIEGLLEKKKAYEVEGDVFYSISSFEEYGFLSGRKPEELLSGTRIETDPRKKNPLDFALWKKTKEGETWSFESPWGQGRPGWHIECTAMIHKFLGEEIDIHAGGSDLIFPHHENEIAQSTGLNKKKYAQFWMHNNMIVMEGDKMSKSLGNMVSMRDFLKDYPGEVFKFLILSCHYRSPLSFSKKSLEQAVVSLFRLYSSLLLAQQQFESFVQRTKTDPVFEKSKPEIDHPLLKNDAHQGVRKTLLRNNDSNKKIEKNKQEFESLNQQRASYKEVQDFEEELKKAEQDIQSAFNDDFATPKAFAVFFSVFHLFQKQDKKLPLELKAQISKSYLAFFKKYGELLSLFQEEPQNFLKDLEDQFLKQRGIKRIDIEKVLEQRTQARKNKDFKKADEFREKLTKWKIDIKDSSEGSQWFFQNFHHDL